MTCRDCDKVAIGGVCSVDGHTIKDFDEPCKIVDKINEPLMEIRV